MRKEYFVSEEDVLRDIFIEMKDLFCGKVEMANGVVQITFDNGQVFNISVKENL